MSAPSTAHAAVTEYRPLVTKIAGHIIRQVPPSVDFDDLMQAGMEGLIEAQEHYDPDQGAAFETYAGIRIRGAMLDQMRVGDWTPRSLYRRKREIAKAIAEIEAEVGRDARAQEVAERLGLDLDEYHRLLGDIDSAHVYGMDYEPTRVALACANEPTPEEALEDAQDEEALSRAIKSLPERERLIVEATYLGDLNLREVGEMLGVTESRVCQLRTQAEARLRARLHDPAALSLS
jgi:RNA polymerase sigma factor FliA